MSDHDPKIIARLDALEQKLPGLLAEYPDDADFWNAFAGESDAIANGAPAAEQAYAQGRIDCMLKNQGLIPGEEEGVPCR